MPYSDKIKVPGEREHNEQGEVIGHEVIEEMWEVGKWKLGRSLWTVMGLGGRHWAV